MTPSTSSIVTLPFKPLNEGEIFEDLQAKAATFPNLPSKLRVNDFGEISIPERFKTLVLEFGGTNVRASIAGEQDGKLVHKHLVSKNADECGSVDEVLGIGRDYYSSKMNLSVVWSFEVGEYDKRSRHLLTANVVDVDGPSYGKVRHLQESLENGQFVHEILAPFYPDYDSLVTANDTSTTAFFLLGAPGGTDLPHGYYSVGGGVASTGTNATKVLGNNALVVLEAGNHWSLSSDILPPHLLDPYYSIEQLTGSGNNGALVKSRFVQYLDYLKDEDIKYPSEFQELIEEICIKLNDKFIGALEALSLVSVAGIEDAFKHVLTENDVSPDGLTKPALLKIGQYLNQAIVNDMTMAGSLAGILFAYPACEFDSAELEKRKRDGRVGVFSVDSSQAQYSPAYKQAMLSTFDRLSPEGIKLLHAQSIPNLPISPSGIGAAGLSAAFSKQRA